MTNYKEMYYQLFNKISDVIKELQDIQLQAEQMYIDSEEQAIRPFTQEPVEDPPPSQPQKEESPPAARPVPPRGHARQPNLRLFIQPLF